jgi:hypothetical protein
MAQWSALSMTRSSRPGSSSKSGLGRKSVASRSAFHPPASIRRLLVIGTISGRRILFYITRVHLKCLCWIGKWCWCADLSINRRKSYCEKKYYSTITSHNIYSNRFIKLSMLTVTGKRSRNVADLKGQSDGTLDRKAFHCYIYCMYYKIITSTVVQVLPTHFISSTT